MFNRQHPLSKTIHSAPIGTRASIYNQNPALHQSLPPTNEHSRRASIVNALHKNMEIPEDAYLAVDPVDSMDPRRSSVQYLSQSAFGDNYNHINNTQETDRETVISPNRTTNNTAINPEFLSEEDVNSKKCFCSKSLVCLFVLATIIVGAILAVVWILQTSNNGQMQASCVQDFRMNSHCQNDGPNIYRGVDK